MNILVINDDGPEAHGLAVLTKGRKDGVYRREDCDVIP
jgi:broad specificity polyphosphatase/5'/3'-nucleotidase SurE